MECDTSNQLRALSESDWVYFFGIYHHYHHLFKSSDMAHTDTHTHRIYNSLYSNTNSKEETKKKLK